MVMDRTLDLCGMNEHEAGILRLNETQAKKVGIILVFARHFSEHFQRKCFRLYVDLSYIPENLLDFQVFD